MDTVPDPFCGRVRVLFAHRGRNGACGSRRAIQQMAYGTVMEEAESIDIHHIFPRDYCEKKGLPRAKWNSVVNKTPITYSTNREIGGVAPSQYLTKIEKKGQVSPSVLDGYLRTHLIDTGDIRADRFDDFFIKRSTAILNEIEKATGKTVSGRDSDLVIQDFGGALL